MAAKRRIRKVGREPVKEGARLAHQGECYVKWQGMRWVSYVPHCQPTHIQVLGTFPCYSGMRDKEHPWGTRD